MERESDRERAQSRSEFWKSMWYGEDYNITENI